MKYIVTLSPLLKSALLLCAGLSIFGFADNFIMLISDQVGVGQFHFSRSLIASLAVICFAFYFNENLRPKNIKMVLIRLLKTFQIMKISIKKNIIGRMAT